MNRFHRGLPLRHALPCLELVMSNLPQSSCHEPAAKSIPRAPMSKKFKGESKGARLNAQKFFRPHF